VGDALPAETDVLVRDVAARIRLVQNLRAGAVPFGFPQGKPINPAARFLEAVAVVSVIYVLGGLDLAFGVPCAGEHAIAEKISRGVIGQFACAKPSRPPFPLVRPPTSPQNPLDSRLSLLYILS